MWKSTSELGLYCGDLRELPVVLHAIEQMQLRGRRRVDGVESPHHREDAATAARRVDGVGRPKFDFHTGRAAREGAARGRGRVGLVNSRLQGVSIRARVALGDWPKVAAADWLRPRLPQRAGSACAGAAAAVAVAVEFVVDGVPAGVPRLRCCLLVKCSLFTRLHINAWYQSRRAPRLVRIQRLGSVNVEAGWTVSTTNKRKETNINSGVV